MKTLYHYTCVTHLATIFDTGYLKKVESNVSSEREHAGPDVVWLTTDPNARFGSHGLNAMSRLGQIVAPEHDKSRIRFTVQVPNVAVHKWVPWAQARGIKQDWLDIMVDVGGGRKQANTWRVCERQIPMSDWLEVIDMPTGQILWKKG